MHRSVDAAGTSTVKRFWRERVLSGNFPRYNTELFRLIILLYAHINGELILSDVGNELYQRSVLAKSALFLQGELAQLTYLSYEETVKRVEEGKEEEIEISYPVGYRPDKLVIPGTHKYSKKELIDKYGFLGNHQLAINGVYQLVTIIESVLSDLLAIVLKKFPQKIGAKRSIRSSVVLASTSIEEVHIKTIDAVLNELSYKSPKDFAVEFERLMSINLLECSAYHKYIEIKAARDIYIHNNGTANETYISKADSHSRVKAGELLPINTVYFLESFESCIQVIEWLEKNLHEIWHSSDFEFYSESNKSVQ